MTTDIGILKSFRDFLIDKLELVSGSCVVGYPDFDKLPKNSMIYISPDYGELEEQTTLSDLATVNTEVFIVVKGASSDVLIENVFEKFESFWNAVRSNITFGGVVDKSMITGWNYYPSIPGGPTMEAIKIDVVIQYSKTHNRS